MEQHFSACARGLSRRARTNISLIAVSLAASSAAWAGPVSATPGIIQGVVTFTAPFVPDSMTVDARDSNNLYTAQATAAQNGSSCVAGSANWCYSMVVESALANAYYLRPIAYVSKTSPAYITNRVPFPPTALVSITPGATVTWNIPYQPGEISGAFSGNDINNQPLTVNSVYISFNDLSNTFAEPCLGSLEFCPYNSVFQSNASPYQAYLKPPDTYNYLSRAVGFAEGTPLGTEKTEIQFNGNLPLGGTPAAGADVIQNYTLNQVATITGNISAPGQSIYNFSVNASGTTTTGGAFYENFGPANNSATPLTQPVSYTSRIFDFTDFTQPIYIQPLLTLSTDGTTVLQYPATTITGLSAGETQTLNYTGTSATISGSVTFTPPYPAGPGVYPGIQAETQDGGLAQATFTSDATGATYTLPAFGDDWHYWRFGWNFDLGKTGFTSTYFVGQFLTTPAVPDVVVADGGTATANFTFNTALVKVFFSAPTTPAGTTISNPALAITTGSYTNGVFAEDLAETGASTGPGTDVTTAEADAVLRVHGVPFQITPSAWINTSPSTPATGPTTFSPIVITPNPGDVIIVGVPGTLSLTVTSPQNGQTFPTCQITVSGSATGTQNITITVNGQQVTTTSANNPNDPNQVLFTTTITGSSASTQITIVASAPGNTSVTDTLTASATCSALPVPLKVTCPSSTATVGVPYSSEVTVTGGTGPYTWSIVFGKLPDGLTLDSSTGLISGIPTMASQTGSFKIKVVDSTGAVAYTNCSGSCSNGTTVSYGGGQGQNGWGQKGVSSIYTSNGIPLAVYGFSASGRPTNLYSNNVGGNSYLGLSNNSNQNQIDTGHFVQCDFATHISAGATGASFTVTTLDWNATYDVYGSNTLGNVGTLLAGDVPVNSWSSQSPGSTHQIPNFGKYRYICIKAHSGNIQITQVNCSYPCSCAIDVGQSGNNHGGQGGYGGQGGQGNQGGQGGYGGQGGQGNQGGQGSQGGGQGQGQSPGQCGW
jgi:hypothetical protein